MNMLGRKIQKIIVVVLIAAVSTLIINACKKTSQQASGLSNNIQLKILYAGEKGTARFNDFETFLKANFKTVTAIDLKAFDQNQTRDSDVVILDSNGIGRGSFPVSFSKDYSKPTISIGIPGARWCDQMHLKIGYS